MIEVYALNWTIGGNRKRLDCANTGKALQIPNEDYIHYALFNVITDTFWVWTNTGIYHFTSDWEFVEKRDHMQDDQITKNVTWDDTYGCRYAFFGEYIYSVYQVNDTLYIDIWKYDGTKLTTQTDLFTMSNSASRHERLSSNYL